MLQKDPLQTRLASKVLCCGAGIPAVESCKSRWPLPLTGMHLHWSIPSRCKITGGNLRATPWCIKALRKHLSPPLPSRMSTFGTETSDRQFTWVTPFPEIRTPLRKHNLNSWEPASSCACLLLTLHLPEWQPDTGILENCNPEAFEHENKQSRESASYTGISHNHVFFFPCYSLVRDRFLFIHWCQTIASNVE